MWALMASGYGWHSARRLLADAKFSKGLSEIGAGISSGKTEAILGEGLR